MLKDMKQIILLVGLLLTMNGWADVTMNEVNQEISIQWQGNSEDAIKERHPLCLILQRHHRRKQRLLTKSRNEPSQNVPFSVRQ